MCDKMFNNALAIHDAIFENNDVESVGKLPE